MKATGIIRRVDELGRVVIPIEIRNQFNNYHITYLNLYDREYNNKLTS